MKTDKAMFYLLTLAMLLNAVSGIFLYRVFGELKTMLRNGTDSPIVCPQTERV